MYDYIDINVLQGLVLSSVTGLGEGSDEVIFTTVGGRTFKMLHVQDCCEQVDINDVCGDIDDLLNSPILVAEESCSSENPDGVPVPEYQDSFTWTFYRLATISGWVTIRGYGESNGYYSEGVDFVEVKGDPRI